jgi:hypothetical protein
MRHLTSCSLAAALLLPSLVLANPCLVGKVAKIHGQVEIQRAEHAFEPAQGQAICLGDLIRTGTGSVADLHLRDGTKITVGKDSEFAIEQFKIYRQRENVALFSLLKGAFRSITGFITKRPHRYEVKTATATLGVRGTDFWGGYGLTENGLDVIMLEGHGVYVKTAQGQVELDKAGLGTTILPDQAPTAPKVWGDEKVQRAVATITP